MVPNSALFHMLTRTYVLVFYDIINVVVYCFCVLVFTDSAVLVTWQGETLAG